MANYVLDMTKPHRQSFIELVNHDNLPTIGTELTLDDVLLINERPVSEEEGIPREFAVTLQNVEYAKDEVEVYFNKVDLADVTEMTLEGGDFDWYDPEAWEDETSKLEAIAAFKVRALEDGIDLDATTESIEVTYRTDGVTNTNHLDFVVESMVFKAEVSFQLPKHFSEAISTTKLNGFIYDPIAEEDVVF